MASINEAFKLLVKITYLIKLYRAPGTQYRKHSTTESLTSLT